MVNEQTKRMMERLPQWMKMAKDENSVGAQFLDAFAMEFRDVEKMLSDFQQNFYIGTAEVDIIDIIFKVPLASEEITDFIDFDFVTFRFMQGEEELPALDAVNLRRFYERYTEPLFLIDREEGVLYLRVNLDDVQDLDRAFEFISLNGRRHYEYMVHHVWNPFDEFAFLLGVERLYGERNASLKERILDVFRMPANTTKKGLENGIARELGLMSDEVIVEEMKDKETRKSLWTDEGVPKEKMRNYARHINKEMAFTWDNMSYGDAKWKTLENGNLGISFLPHLWDADMSMFLDSEFESGIGDGDDLRVYKPRTESIARAFQSFVGLKGYVESSENIYPEIHFRYKIFAEGKTLNEDYQEESFQYTIKASEIIKPSYRIRGTLNYRYLTDIGFASQSDYTFTGVPTNIQSDEILHRKTDKQVLVKAYLQTSDPKVTPKIKELRLEWRDTADVVHTKSFTLDADFLENSTTVDTELVDTVVNAGVELGFGEFYSMTDSRGAWEEAYNQGIVDKAIDIEEQGSISLRLPKA